MTDSRIQSTATRPSQSAIVKMIMIGALTFVLWVSLIVVSALVYERAGRRDEVHREVSTVWGQQQSLGGLLFWLPYERLQPAKDGDVAVPQTLVALPDSLVMDAEVNTEVRRRSIFSAVVYRTTVVLNGSFKRPDLSRLSPAPSRVHWDRAAITVGVTDLRGVVSVSPLTWGNRAVPLESGGGSSVFESNLRADVPWEPSIETVTFRLEITLNGSERLLFLPVGRTTECNVRSPWPHPGFSGAYLPESRTVDPTGFRASWRVNYLSRPYRQSWIDGASGVKDQIHASAFGVDLLHPVDHYQQTARAVKYGFLFVLMTFVVFLLWEILAGLLLHPIQYMLVGAALVVFFLLLLSLSEHVSFVWAYSIAAAATVTVITGYASRILAGVRAGSAVAACLALLYGVLYALLQLEDLALLVGSILVFLVLAMLMYLTRGVNWYQLKEERA